MLLNPISYADRWFGVLSHILFYPPVSPMAIYIQVRSTELTPKPSDLKDKVVEIWWAYIELTLNYLIDYNKTTLKSRKATGKGNMNSST